MRESEEPVRIWNVPCRELDSQHLLGEHRELHGLVSILVREVEQRRTGDTRRIGYVHHPETKRWRGRLGALYRRHEEEVEEMLHRGFTGHRTPLDAALVGDDSWDYPPVSPDELARDRRDLATHTPGWRRLPRT
jgi:Pyrimidine dimer DNA glycosylase